MVNGWKLLTIFAKYAILDVSQGCKYGSKWFKGVCRKIFYAEKARAKLKAPQKQCSASTEMKCAVVITSTYPT